MESKWYERLKAAREKAKLSLKEASTTYNLNISQQSLIKYEKGEIVPKIDLLEKMCKKYDVTIDYIMYGTSELSKTNSIDGQLVSLFMLLLQNKLSLNAKEKNLKINDSALYRHIFALNAYIEENEISTIDQLSQIIKAIKKMSEEK